MSKDKQTLEMRAARLAHDWWTEGFKVGDKHVEFAAAFAREELERRAAMVNRGFVIDFLRTCKDKAGKEGRYRGGGFTNDDVVEFGRYLLAARLGEEATP